VTRTAVVHGLFQFQRQPTTRISPALGLKFTPIVCRKLNILKAFFIVLRVLLTRFSFFTVSWSVEMWPWSITSLPTAMMKLQNVIHSISCKGLIDLDVGSQLSKKNIFNIFVNPYILSLLFYF